MSIFPGPQGQQELRVVPRASVVIRIFVLMSVHTLSHFSLPEDCRRD